MSGIDNKKKYAKPTAFAKIKDAKLPLEKYLEVENKQLNDAKALALMKPMSIKFMGDGADRTLDDFTSFPKQAKVEDVCAQMTVQELREIVAKQESMEVDDVNFYVKSTIIPNDMRIGQCFADWMGFGLENWPPQFISKPRIQGFEVEVSIPAMRDTSMWDGGKLTQFADRTLVFDVQPTTTTLELKQMIFQKLKIPPERQLLTAMIHDDPRSVYGNHVSLSSASKTMSDYGITNFCAKLVLEKNPFDENGMYVFDDAYWDDRGYHPQPLDCWIPSDSLANRSRPDAQTADPNLPTTILTDRRAADQNRSKAEAKDKAAKK
jgi:hypothetical protein|mmetsp:Transcript_123450/g.193651  ORF Transcript_123450/g.193651 Transcript_123450/m.193651 type:complete len:321 (-) Transcript_123450:3-965(-)|eukprot:CAMPEP_0169204898 /NCGR_PEP_ID=MMETSP1016-20121227/12231_1 /TAXON_ID=342587 /ORGANISM="Karlodinium micrum, Strain CCMP2283" /LENGTH=320 /DNA_ID=CAMNT_0009282011 /DNA_START=54 /DNA_END=1016 /DNA_ORIENTATION=+